MLTRLSRYAFWGALFLVSVSGFLRAQETESSKTLVFRQGQTVYVVAVEGTHRDLSLNKGNLELERRAIRQFVSERMFRVASRIREADFVFLVMLDAQSALETAIAIASEDYMNARNNFDILRNDALWEQTSGLKLKAWEAALSITTIGANVIRQSRSIARDLVKQFHKDIRESPEVRLERKLSYTTGQPSDDEFRNAPTGSGPTFGEIVNKIGVWSEPEATNVLGVPLRQRPHYSRDDVVIGQIYVYRDPLNEFEAYHLSFDVETKKLTTVYAYPRGLSWKQVRGTLGSEFKRVAWQDGTVFYFYEKSRVDVHVDQDGQVLAIILY